MLEGKLWRLRIPTRLLRKRDLYRDNGDDWRRHRVRFAPVWTHWEPIRPRRRWWWWWGAIRGNARYRFDLVD